jgi:predicted metallopeptidase
VQKFLKNKKRRRSKVSGKVDWQRAKDIDKRVKYITSSVDFGWDKSSKIHCFRSKNSKTRSYARIWGLSRIWQLALDENPSYIIEVISERFDNLRQSKQDEVLLHELAHIPKNFSGSLVPHFRKGKRNFNDRVRNLVKEYKRKI